MIGDRSNILARLKALLPNGWFRDQTPILDGVLSGIAYALSGVHSFTSYAKLQTRIATATDGFLDLISGDFFGRTLPRKSGEGDASFRARIQAQLLLERGTRKGLIRALELLTGRTPLVFEPGSIQDTGAYNTNTMGYGVAGAYGSLHLPFQAFITAYRPIGQGIPNIAGYGNPQGAYNTGSQIEYANRGMIAGITDEDIFAAVDTVAPVATIIWTRIKS